MPKGSALLRFCPASFFILVKFFIWGGFVFSSFGVLMFAIAKVVLLLPFYGFVHANGQMGFIKSSSFVYYGDCFEGLMLEIK